MKATPTALALAVNCAHSRAASAEAERTKERGGSQSAEGTTARASVTVREVAKKSIFDYVLLLLCLGHDPVNPTRSSQTQREREGVVNRKREEVALPLLSPVRKEIAPGNPSVCTGFGSNFRRPRTLEGNRSAQFCHQKRRRTNITESST